MIIIVEESEFTNQFEMTSDQISIGRSHENTIQLTNKFISRRHAVIYRNGKNTYIKDGDLFGIRSKFGVWVNKIRVCNLTILNHDDVVTFAVGVELPKLIIRIRDLDEEATTSQL